MGSAEEALLVRAVGGDVDALTTLLQQHGAALRKNIAGRIPQRWQALVSEDDVLQQTYADAYRCIGRFTYRGEGSLLAWLKSLAQRNLGDCLKMLNAQRRGGGRQRVETRNPEDSVDLLYNLVCSSQSTPSRGAARREAQAALQRAVRTLPADYRRVVELYDLEGRSAEEVAAALGRSPGAVYMLRARAHERLCETLGAASRYFSAPG